METIRSILKTKGHAIWALPPEATVFDAIGMLAEKGIGALLVISEGELVGIISERDYARKVILEGKSSKDTLVRDIMTTPVVTVTPDCDVEECMRIVTEHRIRHLPVVDHGRLVGVISIGDLVRSIISDQAHTIEQLHNYISGKYPGA